MIVTKRILAGSLIEITVAVTLLSMVFMFSVLIYINASKTTNSYYKLKLANHLRYIANETVSNKDFIDEEIIFDDYSIKKRVDFYKDYANLIHLKIEGYNKSGRLICSHDRIIYEDVH